MSCLKRWNARPDRLRAHLLDSLASNAQVGSHHCLTETCVLLSPTAASFPRPLSHLLLSSLSAAGTPYERQACGPHPRGAQNLPRCLTLQGPRFSNMTWLLRRQFSLLATLTGLAPRIYHLRCLAAGSLELPHPHKGLQLDRMDFVDLTA